MSISIPTLRGRGRGTSKDNRTRGEQERQGEHPGIDRHHTVKEHKSTGEHWYWIGLVYTRVVLVGVVLLSLSQPSGAGGRGQEPSTTVQKDDGTSKEISGIAEE